MAVLQSLTRNGYIQVTDGGPDQMDGPRLFALTVHLTHFDIERLGWEEGDIIAGLVLSADEKLSTGRMRVSCDAEPDDDAPHRAEQPTELVDAVAGQRELVVARGRASLKTPRSTCRV